MLRILSINSGFLPIIFFLLFYKRNKEKKLWVIFLYALISLATDYSYNLINRKDEFYIFSFFTITEFTLYSLFLYYNFNTNLFKKLLVYSYILFFPVTVYNFFQKKFEHFDSLTASIECILIIFFSVLYLYEQIREPESVFIYTSKKFWIISGFFLYLSSTLFLFLYADKLPDIEQRYYWSINYVFNVVKNIFFSIAFLLRKDPFSNQPFMRNRVYQ